MNEIVLRQEIENLEKEKREKEELLEKIKTDIRLRNDSNVVFKIAQLEQAFVDRDINKLKSVYNSLKSYIDFHTNSVEYELVDPLTEMLKDANSKGLRMPVRLKLDSIFSSGLITLIGGGTGSGKTRFMLNLMLDYGMIEKKKIVLFTLEMPSGTLYNLLLIMWIAHSNRQNPNYNGLTLMEIRNIVKKIGNDKESTIGKEIHSYIKTMKENIHIIKLKRPTPVNMFSSVKFCEIDKGFKYELMLIDYFQLIKPSDKNFKGTITERYNNIADELMEFALENDIPVCLLAQLSQDENRKINSESTSDANGFKYCGDISNDAEMIFKLVRKKNDDGSYESKFELRQVKNRFGQLQTVILDQNMQSGVIKL